MCGENQEINGVTYVAQGSPPRVRGKRFLNHVSLLGNRITPACAGKTPCVLGFCPPLRDHPRVCGENRNLLPAGSEERGSPPRVRGKL